MGSRENSALTTLFKQEQYKDMADNVESSIEFNRDFSTLQISAELPMHASAERVVELVDGAVKDMSKNPVPSGELQSTLIARATQDIYLQENLHYYGMMKSGYLAAGGYAMLRNYRDGLMKVTPQDIQKAAEKHLSARFPVVTLMSPPQKREAEAGAERTPNHYYQETLKNGLTVVVKENDDSRVIGIHLLAKERSLCEGKERRGMTEILQRMLLNSRNAEVSFSQEFESIGAELKAHDDPSIPFDDYYHTPRFAYVRLKLIDAFFEKGIEAAFRIGFASHPHRGVFCGGKKRGCNACSPRGDERAKDGGTHLLRQLL